MKLTEELKQKKKSVKEVSVDLLKMDNETKLKLFDGFVDADLKDEFEFRLGSFNGDVVVNKRTIILYSPEIPMDKLLK